MGTHTVLGAALALAVLVPNTLGQDEPQVQPQAQPREQAPERADPSRPDTPAVTDTASANDRLKAESLARYVDSKRKQAAMANVSLAARAQHDAVRRASSLDALQRRHAALLHLSSSFPARPRSDRIQSDRRPGLHDLAPMKKGQDALGDRRHVDVVHAVGHDVAKDRATDKAHAGAKPSDRTSRDKAKAKPVHKAKSGDRKPRR